MKELDHIPMEQESDGFLIHNALHMWCNYIETGNPVMSAIDAQQAKKPYKAIHVDQMKLIIRLRELAAKYEKIETKK